MGRVRGHMKAEMRRICTSALWFARVIWIMVVARGLGSVRRVVAGGQCLVSDAIGGCGRSRVSVTL